MGRPLARYGTTPAIERRALAGRRLQSQGRRLSEDANFRRFAAALQTNQLSIADYQAFQAGEGEFSPQEAEQYREFAHFFDRIIGVGKIAESAPHLQVGAGAPAAQAEGLRHQIGERQRFMPSASLPIRLMLRVQNARDRVRLVRASMAEGRQMRAIPQSAIDRAERDSARGREMTRQGRELEREAASARTR